MKNIYLFILLILTMTALGQEEVHSKKKKAISEYLQANELIGLQQYNQAQQLLESAIKRDKSFDEAILLLTQLYLQKGEQALANNLVATSGDQLDVEFLNRANYDLALSYWREGKYKVAAAKVDLIGGEIHEKTTRDYDLLKQSIRFSEEESLKELAIEKEVLKYQINQFDLQYFPSIDASGQIVFTARDKRWKSHEQIMVSADSAGFWKSPVLISEKINTDRNEGTASISADGTTLVFTGCNRPKSFGSCDLYISTKVAGQWEEPQILSKHINTEHWESQPSLNLRGDVLYFVSTRPGFGGQDLWVSKKEEGEWTEAENLGEMINTSKDDSSPFIYPDGKTLFFASNGRVGMGGFDLFRTELSANEWKLPFNLGAAINDKNDQVGYAVGLDGWAYFSSALNNGKMQLQRFRMPKEYLPEVSLTKLEITLVDALSKDVIKGIVSVMSEERLLTMQTKSLGQYESLVDTLPVRITAQAEGYMAKEVTIDTQNATILLNPLKIAMEAKAVGFSTAEYGLFDEGKRQLDEVVTFYQSNPGTHFILDSYTDSSGSKTTNDLLAQNRANAVVQYLVEQGLSEHAISVNIIGEELALKEVGDNISSAKYRIVRITTQ